MKKKVNLSLQTTSHLENIFVRLSWNYLTRGNVPGTLQPYNRIRLSLLAVYNMKTKTYIYNCSITKCFSFHKRAFLKTYNFQLILDSKNCYQVRHIQIIKMLKNVTYILELAIKFEKSNCKRFAVEVNGYSLTTCFFKDFDY